MLQLYWNKCDSKVIPRGFYLLNTITKSLFSHDPSTISLSNLTPNMYKSFTNGGGNSTLFVHIHICKLKVN